MKYLKLFLLFVPLAFSSVGHSGSAQVNKQELSVEIESPVHPQNLWVASGSGKSPSV
jgi:hypothetical protein